MRDVGRITVFRCQLHICVVVVVVSYDFRNRASERGEIVASPNEYV